MAGRPTSYKPDYAQQAEKLCLLGATDMEIADFFAVSLATVKNWKAAHPAFLAALKVGKAALDERVERSLYHRAVGYTFESEKVFQYQGEIVRAQTREHVPPDTTAMIFWLKNRRPQDWRDVHKIEHGSAGEFDQIDNAAELRRILTERAKELGAGDVATLLARGKDEAGSKPH